ncbi:MAG: hypothetical protein ACRD32_00765 [Nitrososphaerales archaeon]
MYKPADIEHRLSLVEVMVGPVRKTCKICDEAIDAENTSKEGLLAELCDKCWQMQDAAEFNA